jgi:hypothetical protein
MRAAWPEQRTPQWEVTDACGVVVEYVLIWRIAIKYSGVSALLIIAMESRDDWMNENAEIFCVDNTRANARVIYTKNHCY